MLLPLLQRGLLRHSDSCCTTAARGTIGSCFRNGSAAAPAEDATQPSIKKKTKAKSVPIKGHPLSGLTPPSIVQFIMRECKGPYADLKGYPMNCLVDLISQVKAEAAANKDQIGGAGMCGSPAACQLRSCSCWRSSLPRRLLLNGSSRCCAGCSMTARHARWSTSCSWS